MCWQLCSQIGYYSLAFASAGFNVTAIEPMTQNLLALRASCCLNPSIGRRIRVVPTAVVGEARLNDSCAVLSPFRANDHGDGKLECASNRSDWHCTRKHNGLSQRANFTYFFRYRRFCQQLRAPLRTLDMLLHTLSWFEHARRRGSLSVVKVDTAGSECDVLTSGASSLFHQLSPAAIMVSVGAHQATEGCVRRLAEEHGYAVHAIAGTVHLRTKHVVLSRGDTAKTESVTEATSLGRVWRVDR